MDGYRSDFSSLTLFCINGMLIRTSAKAKCKRGFTFGADDIGKRNRTTDDPRLFDI